MSEIPMMVPVPFHSDTVWAAETDGDVLVAVKPICEGLGLQWAGQLKRLKRTAVLAKGMSIMDIPSPGGAQETVCLPLKLLPGWLIGVETKMVKPEIRAKLEQYQAECYEVLYRHFRGGGGQRPAVAGSEHVHKWIVGNLHPHQLRVLMAIEAYGHIDFETVCSHTGLSHENSVRATLLLHYLGVIEPRQDADGRICMRVVPPHERPFLPLPVLQGGSPTLR